MNHVYRLWIASLIGLSSLTVSALDFKIDGEVAVVSGTMDYPDTRRFRDAKEKGVKVIVLRAIGGGDIEVNFRVAKAIEELGFTMVTDGVCGGGCASLLLAGKERRYMKPTQDSSSVVIIRSAVYVGYIQGAANISEVYVHFRPRITDVISDAHLRKYTTGQVSNGGLLFWPANKANQVVECEDLRKINECKPIEGATALNTGMFTVAEHYELPASSPAAGDAGKTS